MYAYISGRLADIQEGIVVIDNGGIGYELAVSNTTLAQLPSMGNVVKLYVYHQISDDGEALYGFASPAEKKMFVKLIGVSGVGPKVAQSILGGLSVSALSTAILTGDTKSLSMVKGIGKKTAERIVLELRENVGQDSVLLSATSAAVGGVTAGSVDTVCADALDALESMGLARSDAYELVLRARQTHDNVADIVRAVLKGWRADK